MKVALLHGPNFRFLGLREVQVYGAFSLEDIGKSLYAFAELVHKPLELASFQTNEEGALIDYLERIWQEQYQGIILNAGAYTHTSIAIADALAWIQIPTVEVHISNIYAREDFRGRTYIAKHCIASIQGCGVLGYKFALETLFNAVQ